jgi:hypothetical protein
MGVPSGIALRNSRRYADDMSNIKVVAGAAWILLVGAAGVAAGGLDSLGAAAVVVGLGIVPLAMTFSPWNALQLRAVPIT